MIDILSQKNEYPWHNLFIKIKYLLIINDIPK